MCSPGSTVETEICLKLPCSLVRPHRPMFYPSLLTHSANEPSAFQIYPLMLGRCISSLN